MRRSYVFVQGAGDIYKYSDYDSSCLVHSAVGSECRFGEGGSDCLRREAEGERTWGSQKNTWQKMVSACVNELRFREMMVCGVCKPDA